MNKAHISDLNLDLNQKLTSEVKKALVSIIQTEFNSQRSVQLINLEEQKQKAMNDYRKSVGFEKLKSQVDKAQHAYTLALDKIKRVGLGTDGEIASWSYGDPEDIKRACRNAHAVLEKVSNAHAQPENFKNKVIARLWMANTMAEANVILNEVLGNGVIPTLDKNQLALPEPKQ